MPPKSLLDRIDEKLKIIKAQRPLSKSIIKKLKEQLALELTYNSNAIEGNKLTLKEAYLVIKDGLTVKGKSLQDHLEAKNHDQAIHFLYDLVEYEKRQTISEQLIRSLQQVIIKDIEDNEAGKYRSGNVMITGSKHKPPQASEIPYLMQEFVEWVKKNFNKIHPVILASQAHHKLVHIHPFADGNGRTARLFMNLILMQHGYPVVVILKNERKKYYSALEKADKGRVDDIEKLIAQAVERSLNIYIQAIKSTSNSKEKLILLSELAMHSNFSEKYLNLLARSGKLDAHKENRNWLSSRKALEEYLKNRERKRNHTSKATKKLFELPGERPPVHPWRSCPYGEHWVKAHELHTHPSKTHPEGLDTTRQEHCAKNPSGKDQLYPDEIQKIANEHFSDLKNNPCSLSLNFPNGSKYDDFIGGWVQYWNDILKPDMLLDPNLVKALIASESSFNPNKLAKKNDSDSARGLMQVTNKTRKLLDGDRGDLKDHFVTVAKEELNDPNINICAGVRWLFEKRRLESSHLKRSASWVETIWGYKAVQKAKTKKDKKKIKDILGKYYKELQKCGSK